MASASPSFESFVSPPSSPCVVASGVIMVIVAAASVPIAASVYRAERHTLLSDMWLYTHLSRAAGKERGES